MGYVKRVIGEGVEQKTRQGYDDTRNRETKPEENIN